MSLYCGIDWSERHHDVAVVDYTGALVVKRRIGDSPDVDRKPLPTHRGGRRAGEPKS